MHNLYLDQRVVMTLDAGGTSFRFSAMQAGKLVVKPVVMPSCPNDLDACLRRLVEGFQCVKTACPAPPAAISFAFPGPADYPLGIIGDLGNLPCFRGGVALGPMLKDQFEIPVFINNDGDLFTYGEALGGFLPHVNELLEKAGTPKRFQNLLGVTLGTGLGGGIVRNGEIFIGDNSVAGEMWLLRNKLSPAMNAEEGASIRAVKSVYAERAGLAMNEAPEPDEICRIAQDGKLGNQPAALEAFRRLGETVGDAMGNALTLVDGLAVIGGGLARASAIFLPALVAELNGEYVLPNGERIRRLSVEVFNLDDPGSLAEFLKNRVREIKVPDGHTPGVRRSRTVSYDPLPRIGIGTTRLGTSEAVAMGAYAFALEKLGM